MTVTLFACNNSETVSNPQNEAELDNYLETVMQRNNIVGASLMVLKNGAPIKKSHLGKSSLQGDNITEQTTFQLASATKFFTGTLAMIFVDRDSIALDDQLGDYLSDIPDNWKEIKLMQLLSHTSGLPRMLNPQTGEMLGSDLSETVAKTKAKESLSKAGEEWNYNQLGFYLVGQVLERISGESWDSLLQKEIFIPLDMQNSSYSKNEKTAESYSIINTEEPEPFQFDYLVKQAGGVHTTASDLTKFMKGLQANKLFSEKTRKVMWSKVELIDRSYADYGLGWDMRTMNEEQTVGHSGGRKAVLTHFPDDEITVIFLTNTYGSDPIQYVSPIKSVFD